MGLNRPQILIVEDDTSLAEWMCDYLQMHDYDVKLVNQGDLAVDAVRRHKPDLVLLDIMLPNKSGFDICQEIRRFYSCPILMMTACAEEASELRSLELGADDYLNKPLRSKVLLARIHALLRRSSHDANKAELVFGALSLQQQTKTVILRGETLPVSGHEFDVLWLLASRPGQVISRDELVSQLRGFDYDGFDRAIDIRISRLRKKLSDDAKQPTRLKTIWGKGYVFVNEEW